MPKKAKPTLPDKAPKKTGRRGIGPIDAVKDFDTPIKKDPPVAKGSLLAEQPPKPKVVGDRMEAFYVKPIFGKTTKGDITVSLAITLPLEENHDGLLPKIVHDGYKEHSKESAQSHQFF